MYYIPLPGRPLLRLTSQCTDRTKRVKDAKQEAQKEIDEYRQKKEEEFKKYESEVPIPGSIAFELC